MQRVVNDKGAWHLSRVMGSCADTPLSVNDFRLTQGNTGVLASIDNITERICQK